MSDLFSAPERKRLQEALEDPGWWEFLHEVLISLREQPRLDWRAVAVVIRQERHFQDAASRHE